MKIRIGVGGWSYFDAESGDRLKAYAKAFDFTEVNSTFYEFPSEKMVRSWRSRVPPDFEFAVRCHRSITHQLKFEPCHEAFEKFDRMWRICRLLRARILHFQTAPTTIWTSARIRAIQDFLATVRRDGLTLALEVRTNDGASKLPAGLFHVMDENDMIHCVDVSRGEVPKVKSDTLYTRLFGKGEHNIYQFSDEELGQITRTAQGRKERAVLAFHNVRMYRDAARLKIYQQTGRFAPVTRFTGLDSLCAILKEDARFPSTKRDLMVTQGWKLYDVTSQEKARVGDALEKLPEKTYQSMEDLLRDLRNRFQR